MTNDAQIEYWNDQAGQTWAEMQPLLDRQLAPLGERAMAALAPAPGERIVDIGCGCGDTTRQLGALVAPGGSVLGIDVSEPMLAVARAAPAAPHVRFMARDAQTAQWPEKFDAAFSRFGVMFFADPAAAFGNIHAALRPGGRLAFVCWRAAAENPWMMVPLAAALRFLPAPPPSDLFEPGPFAFADAARLRSIIAAAGFSAIAIEPCDTLIGGLGLDQALTVALRVGPLGKMLRENPARVPELTDAVRDALATHLTPDGVLLASATWIVTAAA